MKNISLILTSGIYPPDKGGPAFFVSDFSRWLSSKSITTRVVSLKDGPSTKEILPDSEVLLTSRDKLLPFRMLSSIRAIATGTRVTKVILMNDIATEHYNITLYEIEQGMTIEQIRFILKEYEAEELYEECQGIHLALEIVLFNILTQLIKQSKKQKIKIRWKRK